VICIAKSILKFGWFGLFLLLVNGCSLIVPKVIPFDDLPAPAGPYAVGTQTFTWQDNSREETFTPEDGDKRRVVVQIWYPAEPTDDQPVTYLPDPELRMGPFAKSSGLPKFLLNHMRWVATNSHARAPVREELTELPLVLFSHGLGGMKNQNSVQMEELASRGYFVAAVDHPYDAYLTIFDDGTTADYRSSHDGIDSEEAFWAFRGPQLNTRAKDMSFLLDQIQARKNQNLPLWQNISTERVGIFGHSFGGATSILTAANDPRISAVIALDGWMVPVPPQTIEAGLNVPMLYMGQPEWQGTPLNYEKLDLLISNSSGASEKLLIKETKHMDFSDAPQFSNFAKRIGYAGKISSTELKEILNSETLQFFNTQIRGQGQK
jgi:pimeloyl-ACP methyl ester carboxylesterase